VAAARVQIKLHAHALPLIALGMFMRPRETGTRLAACGQVLARFALFLLGIQATPT